MTPDPTTWRAQATSCLRWLAFHVRVARLAESRGDAHGARLAWLGAWRHAELRAEYEGRTRTLSPRNIAHEAVA